MQRGPLNKRADCDQHVIVRLKTNRLCGVSHAEQNTSVRRSETTTNIQPSRFHRKLLYTLLHSQELDELLVYAMCGIRCDMAADGGDVMLLRCSCV